MKAKRISLRTWCAVFSAILISTGLAWACFYMDFDPPSNFSPELMMRDAEAYRPLFYDPNTTFYNGHDDQHPRRFNEEVTNDWYDFLDGKLTREQIAAFMLEGKKVAAIANSSSPKVKAFERFVRLAHQVDNYACTPIDPWSYYNNPQSDTPQKASEELVEEAIRDYRAETNAFLKNRYAFQALKALFCAGNRDAFERFFGEVEPNMPRNTLYYRALGYRAGFYIEVKDFCNANLLYAEVFNHVPAMRPVAATSLTLQDEKQWEQCLRAASPEQKTALWALLAFRTGDNDRAIRSIYQIRPKDPLLSLLVIRFINENEDRRWSLIGPPTEDADPKANRMKEISRETFDLIRRIASEEKTENPFLWYAAAGYITSWSGDYDGANSLYDKAAGQMKAGNKEAADQLRLLRLVNALNRITEVKGDNVERLTEELRWLYKQNSYPEYGEGGMRYKTAIIQSATYLSTLYAKAGRPELAEMLDHSSEKIAQPGVVDKLIAVLENPRTPMEKLIVDMYPYTAEEFYFYKALQALHADQLIEAEALMKKAGKQGMTELYTNPFNDYILDPLDAHTRKHIKEAKVKYTPITLIQKMREGEAKIARGEEVYNNSLLVGNAFYNMSFYGTSDIWRVPLLNASIFELVPCYAQEMVMTSPAAKKYYRMALKAATTDEQRAKAVFLSIKCDRNDCYLGPIRGRALCDNQRYMNQSNSPNWLDRDGFGELMRYANTQYYRDVIRECGYFQLYVAKHKR